MLVGARQAGFKVIGNVEWRKYYHRLDEHGRNTFSENFGRELPFPYKAEDLTPQDVEKLMGADVAFGHPECGNFSLLSGTVPADHSLDPGDIPLFVDLVAKFRPRFFVMDDLPPSFSAFPMSEYHERLPDYDLFPEWVSNWGYGNVQRHRNRMFMIGSRRDERWAFRPGEAEHSDTLETTIGDLPEPRRGSNYPNHDPCAMAEEAGRHLSMRFIGDRPTWAEVRDYAKDNWPQGRNVNYYANDGTIKVKPGCKVEYWGERGASVMDGSSYKFHPIRFDNLTVRERARIQGFPDDFVFYGSKLNDRGEYNFDQNHEMTKQTGKAMPIQFCRYVARQIHSHVSGEPFESSGRRILKPNRFVDEAKLWYCANVGYSDQERACSECWLAAGCSLKTSVRQKLVVEQPTRDLEARLPRAPRDRRERVLTLRAPSAHNRFADKDEYEDLKF